MQIKAKRSPSTNIIRDAEREMQYVVTPNAVNAIQQISKDFHFGFHSHIIVGSYGTGKSSMLQAFEQSLKGKSKHFDVSGLSAKPKDVRIIRFVGEFTSIIKAFSEEFNIKKLSSGNQQIFDAIYQQYEPIRKNGLLVIFIDELGKYLEYAAQHEAEKELYFIQQLAEFVNDPDRRILLISTLHQNFEAYSFKLNERQRNEWIKVKGRLKEITFNEPVEQLLELAASIIDAKPDKKNAKFQNKIVELTSEHFLFRLKKDFVAKISNKLFPLDFISAGCLTKALQEYGQNERSLFSFIDSHDFTELKKEGHLLDVAWLYDYLYVAFYSFLNSKHNPHFNAWLEIKDCIERIEVLLPTSSGDASKLIKTIGLLNIFTSKGAKLNEEFLLSYIDEGEQPAKIKSVIKELIGHKVIKYNKFNDSYRLFEGTDVDIDKALEEELVDEIFDVPAYLNKHFGKLPCVTAKEATYVSGTTRNFKFVASEELKHLKAKEELDGYINLIISENISEPAVREHSRNDEEANIYGLFKNSDKIKFFLYEIEKAQNVRSKNDGDNVVEKEMKTIIKSNINLLHHYFIDAIYTDDVVWVYQGKKQKISSKKQFNQLLSRAVTDVYPHTPIFKNELANRHKISSSIHTARKDLFARVVNNWNEKDLNYGSNFPPDKTIYISLLRENYIHRAIKNAFTLGAPGRNSSFINVWDACEKFLAASKNEKRPITELYDVLLDKPFKLKLGLAEFIVPLFLFIRRDDYALFGENGYIPEINETVLLLFARNSEEYSIKAFNLDKVKLDLFAKYREFLQQSTQNKPTNESFIESIKPFLVFYKQLPDYSKSTKQLSSEAIAVREAIVNSTDPEKTFFEDFPNALHTSIKELSGSKAALKVYVEKLKKTINEIRSSYDELLNRIELFILQDIVGEDVSFEEYKTSLQKRISNIKEHSMMNYHKVFHQRVFSPLDDRKLWLSSLTQALINKPLESIKDDEEKILKDKFKSIIHELDNLAEISNVQTDNEKEKVFKFEVTSDGIANKTIVKIPKSKFSELARTKESVKKQLTQDKQINIAVLTNLIQEQLKNE